MKTRCPHCKSGFKIKEEYLGKKLKCPKCNTPFVANSTDAVDVQNTASADTTSHHAFQPTAIENLENQHFPEIHLGLIPKKFRQYLSSDEKILYASNPSNGALFLSIALPSVFLLSSLAVLFLHPAIGFAFTIFWGLVTLIIYLSWKNKYYVITDKRTFASEGIFNIAVSIIPNKSIQMVCINTGIIDRLLGLNTLEISSAAQGGTNIFLAFAGKSKGTIRFSSISCVHEVVRMYHQVFA